MQASNELEAAINARLAAAERLLRSAAMVGDGDSHRLWQSSRDLWVATTARNLGCAVDEHVIRTFQRAVAAPPGEGHVAADLPVELEAVRQAMAVLIGVRSQASAGAVPAGTERRGPRLGP